MAIRTDLDINEVTYNGTPIPLVGSSGGVTSVNGKTGAVVLDAADVGALPSSTSIPTESTVSGWGFTKNSGTVTSVAVKMNGSTKGTVTSSGTIDLGTVITSHQDISGKENTSNKTTSISSSSTDTQYPSAKAVYSSIPKFQKVTASFSNGVAQVTCTGVTSSSAIMAIRVGTAGDTSGNYSTIIGAACYYTTNKIKLFLADSTTGSYDVFVWWTT